LLKLSNTVHRKDYPGPPDIPAIISARIEDIKIQKQLLSMVLTVVGQITFENNSIRGLLCEFEKNLDPKKNEGIG
jgi:hypothetical protein